VRDDLDVYEHPYVKRLEAQVEKTEAKYEAQVRRTEEIQMKSQEKLLELQRMTTIGQSKTLADFMLEAKNWIIGTDAKPPREQGSERATNRLVIPTHGIGRSLFARYHRL
jgi:hypothetical protein